MRLQKRMISLCIFFLPLVFCSEHEKDLVEVEVVKRSRKSSSNALRVSAEYIKDKSDDPNAHDKIELTRRDSKPTDLAKLYLASKQAKSIETSPRANANRKYPTKANKQSLSATYTAKKQNNVSE